jgi:hypothetical protein
VRFRGCHERAADAAAAVLVAHVQVGQLGARRAVADGGPHLDAGEAVQRAVQVRQQRDLAAGTGGDAFGEPVGLRVGAPEGLQQRRQARGVGRGGGAERRDDSAVRIAPPLRWRGSPGACTPSTRRTLSVVSVRIATPGVVTVASRAGVVQ